MIFTLKKQAAPFFILLSKFIRVLLVTFLFVISIVNLDFILDLGFLICFSHIKILFEFFIGLFLFRSVIISFESICWDITFFVWAKEFFAWLIVINFALCGNFTDFSPFNALLDLAINFDEEVKEVVLCPSVLEQVFFNSGMSPRAFASFCLGAVVHVLKDFSQKPDSLNVNPIEDTLRYERELENRLIEIILPRSTTHGPILSEIFSGNRFCDLPPSNRYLLKDIFSIGFNPLYLARLKIRLWLGYYFDNGNAQEFANLEVSHARTEAEIYLLTNSAWRKATATGHAITTLAGYYHILQMPAFVKYWNPPLIKMLTTPAIEKFIAHPIIQFTIYGTNTTVAQIRLLDLMRKNPITMIGTGVFLAVSSFVNSSLLLQPLPPNDLLAHAMLNLELLGVPEANNNYPRIIINQQAFRLRNFLLAIEPAHPIAAIKFTALEYKEMIDYYETNKTDVKNLNGEPFEE
jgi:hypothetical protein